MYKGVSELRILLYADVKSKASEVTAVDAKIPIMRGKLLIVVLDGQDKGVSRGDQVEVHPIYR